MTNKATITMNDSLTNLVSGLGTDRDKRMHNNFTFSAVNANWVELEIAYMENWLAAQIVNVPVDDGLREWREHTNEDSELISAEEKRLGVREKFKLAQYWARLFGGSVILMLTDQDLTKPLDVRRVRKGSLRNLVVLDRWDVMPQDINYTDPTALDFMLPKTYRIVNGGQDIHESHVIRCDGLEVSRRARQLNLGWGDSILRKVLEDIKDITSAKGGIAALIQEANVDVISRNGLSTELTTGEEANVLKRFKLAAQLKSFIHVLLLDGENETYDRKQLAFSGLAQILDQLMVWTAGAADIPMERLFGVQSKGLGDTGQGSLKNYYDKVASEQESRFRPGLEKLDHVLIRSAIGEYPDDYDWKWNPLYQSSGIEMAQEDLAVAQSEDIRLQQGVIKRSHIALRLKQENKYAISEAEIADIQKQETEEAALGRIDDPDFNGNEYGSPDTEFKTEPGVNNIDPEKTLNGAQVTALLDILAKIRMGEISKQTAVKVIVTSFPVSEVEAQALLKEVEEGHYTEPEPAPAPIAVE